MAKRYAGVAKKRKEVLRSDRNTMEQLNKQCDVLLRGIAIREEKKQKNITITNKKNISATQDM